MTDLSNKQLRSLKKEAKLILAWHSVDPREIKGYLHFLNKISHPTNHLDDFSQLPKKYLGALMIKIDDLGIEYATLSLDKSVNRSSAKSNNLEPNVSKKTLDKLCIEKVRLNLRMLGYKVSVKDDSQALRDTLQRRLLTKNVSD